MISGQKNRLKAEKNDGFPIGSGRKSLTHIAAK